MKFSQRFRRASALCIAFLSLQAIGPLLGEGETEAPSDFIRFVDEEEFGELQVALTSYLNADGIKLDLIGAVHIGDHAYYQDLNKRFENYDVVLFEMVGDPEDLHKPELKEKPNPVRMLQKALTGVLDLEYQLDGIDYTAPNLVHADLSVKEFLQMQKDRGESLFTFIQKVMQAQFETEGAAPPEVGLIQLLRILLSGDHAGGLKLLVAEQLAATEALLGAVEEGEGTVLLSERNKRVIEVLQEETKKEVERLAIFYGAGHYIDLEKRVRGLGYRKVGQSWLTAWSIPKPQKRAPDPPKPGNQT